MATTVTGVLFKDAEIKTSAAGRDYTTLVVKRSEYDSTQKKAVSVFYNVTAFGDRYAKMTEKLLKSGAVIEVTGKLNPRAYVGKNGQAAVSRDIVADSLDFICFAQQDNRASSGGNEDEGF